MVGSEILGSILATSTAKSVIKFLDDRVAEYIGKKFENTPPRDIEALKKEIEELKLRLEAKEDYEVSQTDVEEVNSTLSKIDQKQISLSDKIISVSIFQEWSKNLDIEDLAPILNRELNVLVDKAKELKISDKKRYEIQNLINALFMNYNDLITARRQFQMTLLPAYDQQAKLSEIALRNTIQEAKNYLKFYYNS